MDRHCPAFLGRLSLTSVTTEADLQGGSFLYVATVIQPLSNDAHAQGSHSSGHAPHEETVELGKYQRTALLIVGMLGPVVLSMIVGDAH